MKDKGEIFERLLHAAARNKVKVQMFPGLKGAYGRIRERRIGIASNQRIDEINYTLAHELAHFYLHSDKGNIMGKSNEWEYEEQADRAAKMLLDVLSE